MPNPLAELTDLASNNWLEQPKDEGGLLCIKST